MSGGYWEYENESFAERLFGIEVPKPWSEEFPKCRKKALQMNQLFDAEVTAMAYDLFGLIVALDYYHECDIGPDGYREEVEKFKHHWMRPLSKTRIDGIQKYVDDRCGDLKAQIKRLLEQEVSDGDLSE